jgi:hypothetical protein
MRGTCFQRGRKEIDINKEGEREMYINEWERGRKREILIYKEGERGRGVKQVGRMSLPL